MRVGLAPRPGFCCQSFAPALVRLAKTICSLLVGQAPPTTDKDRQAILGELRNCPDKTEREPQLALRQVNLRQWQVNLRPAAALGPRS